MDDQKNLQIDKLAKTQAESLQAEQVENKEMGDDIQSKQTQNEDNSDLDQPLQPESDIPPAGIVGEKKAMFSVKNEDKGYHLQSKQMKNEDKRDYLQSKQMKNEDKRDHVQSEEMKNED